MLCGVDEAGRGPVIGPMVVAAVVIRDEAPLKDLGVKDSKKLTAARREMMAREIPKLARVELEVVGPEVIDEHTDGHLNRFEAEVFGRLVEKTRAEEVFLDACDTSEKRFGRMVTSHLSYRPRIVCEHKADDRYPVVSAASIMAKVRRDAEIHRISSELGEDVGTGYAHDKVTIAFLERWIKEKGSLPPYARRSWATARQAMSVARNRKLTDWDE